MNEIVTTIVNETFDVRRHLARMRVWQDEWSSEDEQLRARLRPLKTNKFLDKQLGNQIGRFRKRLKMRRVREPLEISAKSIETEEGYRLLRENLARQFLALSKENTLLWLNNFFFIIQPQLLQLHEMTKKCPA